MREILDKLGIRTVYEQIMYLIYNAPGLIRETVYKEDGEYIHNRVVNLSSIWDSENLVMVFPFQHMFAGEVLTEKQWIERLNSEIAEFLSLQTGGGKTYLSVFKIAKYIWKIKRKKTIIFVSRAALKLKLKYDAIESAGTDQGIDSEDRIKLEHHFGFIDIYSYQDMANDFVTNTSSSSCMKEIRESIKDYGVCIFDECHFFVQDSDFNAYTEDIFNTLVGLFYDKRIPRVYMTATPEYVLDSIVEIERRLCKNKLWNNIYNRKHPERLQINHPIINYNHFHRDYSYLDIKFLPEDKESMTSITEMVLEYPRHKFLVFMDSKDGEEKLKSHLLISGLNEEAVAVLNSDRIHEAEKSEKTKELLRSLGKEEKLPEGVRILISTKCLDVGITIRDKPMVIVCFLNDPVDIIQAVGRKRICDKKDCVILFLPNYKKGTVKKWLSRLNLKKKEYDELLEKYREGHNVNGAFFPCPVHAKNGKYYFNHFSKVKLECQITVFERLQLLIDKGQTDKEALLQYYDSLFPGANLPDAFREQKGDSKLSDENKAEILKILEEYPLGSIESNRIEEFFDKISRYDVRVRKVDRRFTINAANKILKEVGRSIHKITGESNKGMFQIKTLKEEQK